MAQKRTIAVVTGSRAEFGLLATVMRAIRAHAALELRTVVAGLHLVTGTWRDVKRDEAAGGDGTDAERGDEAQAERGFAIDAKVRMQRKGETGRAADVAAVSRGVAGFGKAFAEMRPDAVVVLGDRIEAFAAATAASIGGFRVAHIHGGDRAEGVADEAMRHAISKMAHIHFAATALSRKRLVRMGEDASRVFNVGSPAIDLLKRSVSDGDPPSRGLVVLQHPIGETDEQEQQWMKATLAAAEAAHQESWRASTLIDPNLDAGHAGVLAAIENRVPKTLPNGGFASPWFRYRHLQRRDFLVILAGARAIVGNSSAGLIEAAALKVPCVNIGPRQDGREKPANVIDCNYGEKSVRQAIGKALKLDLRRMRHPYGNGKTGEKIAQKLATMDLTKVPIRKRNAY